MVLALEMLKPDVNLLSNCRHLHRPMVSETLWPGLKGSVA